MKTTMLLQDAAPVAGMPPDASPAPAPHGAAPASRSKRARVSGWGRMPAAETDLYRPERHRLLAAALAASGTLVARGLGRSYGDASYNSAGATVLMERLNRFVSFDEATGVVDCEAGVTFVDLLDHFVPRGYFPPVTPGTKYVTVGGALACDVHGKNHHVDGSFARHVLDFDLLTASGEIIRCDRERSVDLFRATVGGMGLTGIVTRVRFTLQRIETAYIAADYARAANLDDALQQFEGEDDRYRYSVAWIDCLARGRSLGRSVLIRGNAASSEIVVRAGIRAPLRASRSRGLPLSVPFEAPGWLLNRHSVGAFNALYYRMQSLAARGRVVRFDPFFYPLDAIGNWNRLYGRRGFVQYQLLLPPAAARDGLRDALRILSDAGAPGFLAVLKRFGDVAPEGLLSFPGAGYTLALDVPWRGERTEALLAALDRVVLGAGGRLYFAKDARLRREHVGAMYPRLAEWQSIRRRVDPDGRFSSDLGRRLGLVP
jgi:decaprenylphospho-beta-D-ribofuranose 2-oxidase